MAAFRVCELLKIDDPLCWMDMDRGGRNLDRWIAYLNCKSTLGQSEMSDPATVLAQLQEKY